MKTKLWAILLMFLCTILTSSAQIFYKKSAPALELDLIALISNHYLIIGMAIYIVGAFLMITAFRGGDVSVLYPIIATSYIWVSFLSIFFLAESMNVLKWLGIIGIIIGIVFVGFGSKDKNSKEHLQTPGVV